MLTVPFSSGNARLANLEEDLGLQNQDFNAILSVFYITYSLCEIPSMLLCKYIGPGYFLPLATLGFGIVTIGTAFCQNKGQMIACRILLGVFEAGLLPGVAYYLSRWYRHAELAFRLGMYMVMTPTSGAFGGLLASGILSLDRVGSLTEWRMIFGIEGIITCGIALILLFLLTDSPATARWLSAEEKELATLRVLSERVGQEEILDKMNLTKIKNGFLNPVALVTAFIFFCGNVVVLGISFFLPTIIRTIYPGRTTVEQQLLTVPPYVVGAFFLLLVSWLATRFNTRQVFIFFSAPTVMAGYAILLGSMNANVRYAAIFLTASAAFFGGSLCNAQCSVNTVSDTARSVAIGTNGKLCILGPGSCVPPLMHTTLIVMFGYLGGLVATWTYLPWDGPMYPIGNGLNLAVSGAIGVASIGGFIWMKMDNKRRDERTPAEKEELLAGMTQEEIGNLDWKHPDFRWKP